MAAASPEVLPPTAKRAKGDPTCPEIFPAVPAMATEDGWSALPGDLARCIADSFLDKNDLDYYMCFRGVCPSWRAATDDPSSDIGDSRFHPHGWIVLDEDFQGDGKRVLLNTLTGRFLRKKLPVVLDYYAVGTSRGFFVLAERSLPHAARVFNPLTGGMVRFAAPVPPEVGRCEVDSSLELTVFCDSSRMIYTAAPDSDRFLAGKTNTEAPAVYDSFRKVAVGGVYADISILTSTALAAMRGSLALGSRFTAVCLYGRLLLVVNPPSPFVFEVDMESVAVRPLGSIGRFSIFIGNHRCLPVDTGKFPSIEANCVYFTEDLDSSAYICKFNLEDKKVHRISENADFVKQDKQYVLVADRPLTAIQLLSSYTINIPDSQLPLQQMP